MGDHNTKPEQYNYRVKQREFSDITNSNMTEIETRSSDSIMPKVVNYMMERISPRRTMKACENLRDYSSLLYQCLYSYQDITVSNQYKLLYGG